MTDKKKRNSPDAESSEIKPTIAEMMDDFKKRTRSVYSVNGKFRSQLTECKDGGWSCQIWMYVAEGIERPVLRNIQPFATRDDAIQMTQRCFAQFTGDDRYFAQDDIWKENKPE